MSLGEHLEELRYRLILALIGPVAVGIGLLVFGEEILGLIMAPLQEALLAEGLDPQVYAPSPLTAIAVYFKVAIVGGLTVSVPWILWQAWSFIAPGLYANERRFVTLMMPASIVLGVIGVLFMYFVMLPFTLWFLVFFATDFDLPEVKPNPLLPSPHVPESVSNTPKLFQIPMTRQDPAEPQVGQMWIKVPEFELRLYAGGDLQTPVLWTTKLKQRSMIQPLFHIDQYVNLVVFFALGFVIAFQLPLVMLLLARVGILSYRQMRHHWRAALMGSAVAGAILTPQDPISMLALAIPLYVLYEFGLILVRLFAAEAPPVGSSD
ncbi:MAG: twin-arginine translocase subunit TatC [Phycisphaerae bacterium]|nr:twin-arginine translocase subunit TatC [Phycisphaerae bacterium]